MPNRCQHLFPVLTLGAALGVALAAAPASAGTWYVPSPDTGGTGHPETHLEMSQGGPRQLTPTFIPTGVNGSNLTGHPVGVDNDVKPNVFNVRRYIDGAGMLKVAGPSGIQVRSGAMFLSSGASTVTWAMPVIGDSDMFQPGETAYLKGLAHTPQGASNIEVMNFGAATASCQIQLRRPKGGLLGSSRSLPLLPMSHLVVEDPLQGNLETPAASGVRAEVSCSQPFYAYGTFVGDGPAAFRMLYPLGAPSAADVETLTINKPGTFFSPVRGKSAMDVVLPLVPDRAYRKVTIDFDVNIKEFTPIFTGLVGMYHPGGPRFGKTLYFGTFVRGMRSRSLVDQGSPVVEPALKFGTGWKEGATHHVMIVYDTEAGMMRFQVSRNNAVLADYTGSAYNYDLADRGAPVRLTFGLNGIADNAYFPPVGWKFSNLKVVITR
jgi:hypothetical protein